MDALSDLWRGMIMRSRLAPTGAFLSVLGLMAWLALGEPGPSGPTEPPAHPSLEVMPEDRGGGSAAPCAIPLRWRVASVDDRFGLTPAQARAAVQDAVRLWEDAMHRSLFSEDLRAGFPIRFVYDERRARTQEWSRRLKEFERVGERIEEEKARLDDRESRFSVAWAEHEQRLKDLEAQVSSHDATVRDWNQKGGAPEEVFLELRFAEKSLERIHRQLSSERLSLDALSDTLRDEADRIRQEIQEHNRQGVALERAFPPVAIQSGLYKEAVIKEEGRLASVRREIDIYDFSDVNTLPVVVAHELGHSLGIGHDARSGAVMSEEHGRADLPAVQAIQPRDIELLRARCPTL